MASWRCWIGLLHHYRAVNVEHLLRGAIWEHDPKEMAPITAVLERCQDCGRHRVVKMEGHWEITDFADRYQEAP